MGRSDRHAGQHCIEISHERSCNIVGQRPLTLATLRNDVKLECRLNTRAKSCSSSFTYYFSTIPFQFASSDDGL